MLRNLLLNKLVPKLGIHSSTNVQVNATRGKRKKVLIGIVAKVGRDGFSVSPGPAPDPVLGPNELADDFFRIDGTVF